MAVAVGTWVVGYGVGAEPLKLEIFVGFLILLEV